MMKALVLREIGKPMVIEDVPVPTCGPNDVLIKVEATGVCHTDEFIARAGFPGMSLPHVLGHEGAGTIVQLGSAVQGWKIGDRVTAPMYAGSCGNCYFCESDLYLQCTERKMHAANIWGSYAEYMISNPKTIVAIPENVGYEKAGPCGCAGVTVTGAVRRAKAPKGSWIAFSGAGGLGLIGIQVAKAQGYKVLSIDIDDTKLAEATRVGADAVVNAKTAGDKMAEQVVALTDGGLAANIIVTTAASAVEGSIACMRGGGTIVVIGIIEKNISISPMILLLKDLHILGSELGSVEDARKCLEFVSEGKVNPVTSPCKLSDVPHIFEELEKGTVLGRKVVTDMLH
ncbi:hypothetical protein HDU93_008215 [Gonapodya sp. JEL0774]|nr:hypothetical protein HDU93_008215 [Gonapodya sp. JEL0774]